jgi:hypothetical protein
VKKIFAATTLAISLFGCSALSQALNKPTAPSENETKQFGAPISGVEVTLEQESGTIVKTVRTDAKGQFEFSDIQPGRYRLKVDPSVLSPRDPATGQASGKRLQSTGADSSVAAPRDAATGQASGKRQHAPLAENNDGGANTAANRTGINTSRSNIKNQRVAAEIVTDEEADPTTPAKAGVSTSRSNVRNKKGEITGAADEDVIAVQVFNDEAPVAKRAFVLPHVLEKSGLIVQVGADGRIIGNVLKTRHDTVKNSINNVR